MICKICNQDKKDTEFRQFKARNGKYYHRKECKKCEIEIQVKKNKLNPERCNKNNRVCYLKNKERYNIKSKKYYDENKEKVNNQKKIYNEINKEKLDKNKKKYYENNKEKILLKNKIYRQKNKDILQIKKNKLIKNKYKNDFNYRFKKIISRQIGYQLKRQNSYKKNKTITLLGCSTEFFIKYIESQFTPDINWKNKGIYWDIDHILPCAAFELQNSEEQEICFHYTNLRPLEKIENIKKGNKLIF